MRKCIKNLAIKIKHSNTDKQKHFLSNINIENPPGVKTYSKKVNEKSCTKAFIK